MAPSSSEGHTEAHDASPLHVEPIMISPDTLYTFSSSQTGRTLTYFSQGLNRLRPGGASTHCGAALAGFSGLLLVTAANSLLGPMRDAAALTIGVQHIPKLTLASTMLALCSAVPIGWLFEAPDPSLTRRRFFRRMGFTRGDTQGTSLALFYRCFALILVVYSLGFKINEIMEEEHRHEYRHGNGEKERGTLDAAIIWLVSSIYIIVAPLVSYLHVVGIGKIGYVAFFLVVHLMKLHSISLIWGVVGEAMEYEEHAEMRKKLMIRKENEALRRESQSWQQSQWEETTPEQLKEHLIEGNSATRHMHLENVMRRNNTSDTTLASYSDGDLQNGGDRTPKRQPLYSVVSSAPSFPVNGCIRDSQAIGNPSVQEPASAALHAAAAASQMNRQDVHHVARRDSWSNQNGSNSRSGQRSRARLDRLAFVGLGGTIGGIAGSFVASMTAHILHLSGLLLIACILLFLSANLSVELGTSMQRHWEEQQRVRSYDDLVPLQQHEQQHPVQTEQQGQHFGEEIDDGKRLLSDCDRTVSIVSPLPECNRAVSESSSTAVEEVDTSMKRVSSCGSMKRVASGNSLSQNGIKRVQSGSSLCNSGTGRGRDSRGLDSLVGRRSSDWSSGGNQENGSGTELNSEEEDSFSRRLVRGVGTILRSRLLMAIFTYNALYASTTVLLSFQRAELVANRDDGINKSNTEGDTAFLARINVLSNVAVFALQASGLGALIAHSCGQRGTLALMPIVRLCGVLILAWWHVVGSGKPPNLMLFLMLDEFTRIINFAVAKPVREGLWRGLSNEARYEAKPIVDTLANRWGSGSAAFLVSLIDRILNLWMKHRPDPSGMGNLVSGDSVISNRLVFGFPPILLMCLFIASWWAMVSAHLGHIRGRIDLELKKQA